MLLCLSACSGENTGKSENDLTDEQPEVGNVIQIQGIDMAIKQISMFDSQTGWALTGENEILYTNDGVKNFKKIKKIETAGTNDDNYVSGCFLNAATAYVTYFTEENIVVEYTTNQGTAWNQENNLK